MRDSAVTATKMTKVSRVPYLNLYREACKRNPDMATERVYPAYWQQEPLAVQLAKKQYALMQSGMDKDEAYHQALALVREAERDSYTAIKGLREQLGRNGAASALAGDADLSGFVAHWQGRLAVVAYEDMDLADQGDIDHMVQTKVLKWSEVERERRMCNPVFAFQFEEVRSLLFPSISISSAGAAAGDGMYDMSNVKSDFLACFDVDQSLLSAQKKFMYEDYMHFFNKLKQQPNLGKWAEGDRIELSRWVLSTLAIRQVVEKAGTPHVRGYLEHLRVQFFPMLSSPETASSMVLPSEREVRSLLHSHGIGYSREKENQNEGKDGESSSDKLYIRRFYLLPQLLFPQHVFLSAMVRDQSRLQTVLEGETSLAAEIAAAGLDESLLPDIRACLESYAAQSGLTYDGDDEAVLDDLLSNDSSSSSSSGSSSKLSLGGVGAVTTTNTGSSDGVQGIDARESRPVPQFDFSDSLLDPRIARQPEVGESEYDRDLDAILCASEPYSRDEIASESDAMTFNEARAENLSIIQARLAAAYEEKEAARRAREWKKSGKWLGEEIEHSLLSLT